MKDSWISYMYICVLVNMATKDLPNEQKRTTWVKENLKSVTDNYLDGINVDFEDSIPKSRKDLKDGYTALIRESFNAFRSANPSYQVGVF